MTTAIRARLRNELVSRGFKRDGESPHGTVGLDDAYLADIAISSLLVDMVARREKIFHSVPVVGREIAKNGWDDVVLVIEAIRSVIEERCQ